MRRSLLLIGLLLSAAGCASKAKKYEGAWYGPNGISVTFNADGSFTQAGKMTFAGTWKLVGESAAVSINDKSIDEAVKKITVSKGIKGSTSAIESLKDTLRHIEFTVSEDGKTLSQKIAGWEPATYTRTRQ